MNDGTFFYTSEPHPKRPDVADRVSIPDLGVSCVDFKVGGKWVDPSRPPGQRRGVDITVLDPAGSFEWGVDETEWPYQWPYWAELDG